MSRTYKLASQVRALAAKVDDLNFIPGTHMWRESVDYHKQSSGIHTCTMSHLHALTYTNKLNEQRHWRGMPRLKLV